MDKKIPNRPQFKEKVVQIYANFFSGQDITGGRNEFWDEFFLLRVNIPKLNAYFDKLSVDELLCLKPHINRLFAKCVEALRSAHPYRVANAIQTLNCIFRGILGNKRNLGSSALDLTQLMIGNENISSVMDELVISSNYILLHPNLPVHLKSLILNLLLTITCAYNIINENPLIDFLLCDELFDSLAFILADIFQRQILGQEVCFLMTLLMQHRKFELNNLFRLRMSSLDDELVLHGLSYVLATSFKEYNNEFRRRNAQPQGFLSSLSSMIGSVLVGSECSVQNLQVKDALLLSLYEAVTVNRHFHSTLFYAHGGLYGSTNSNDSSAVGASANVKRSQSIAVTGMTDFEQESEDLQNNVPHPQRHYSWKENTQDSEELEINELSDLKEAEVPSNLLLLFLEYCSIVMQDAKSPNRVNSLHLSFIILLCIAEDQNTCALIHDEHLNFKVKLHRMPMRHRKPFTDDVVRSRPLACAFLDLMVEFMQSHLMRIMPFDLYHISLCIVHRMLCYEKRLTVRLEYDWKHLWSALFNVTRFVLSMEQVFLRMCDIFDLLRQVMNVFNLFITYGDAFLSSPNAYDELYYEIIRMQNVMENAHSLSLRYCTLENEFKPSADRLSSSIQNIRSIINHFSPKIDALANSNGQAAVTEEQVLVVVKNNYESLTLRLLDGLDFYERYKENSAKEKAFFVVLIRCIILSLRSECSDSSLRLQKHLQELTTLS